MVLEIDGKDVECELTPQGLAEVEHYIAELKAKRKEILDAEIDTADYTDIPTVEDIVSDIECFFDEELMEYCNSWGVTDYYDADWPLHLIFGEDIVKKGA
jgi:hypothetical protein